MNSIILNVKINEILGNLHDDLSNHDKKHYIVHLGELELALFLYENETSKVHPEQKNLIHYYYRIWEFN